MTTLAALSAMDDGRNNTTNILHYPKHLNFPILYDFVLCCIILPGVEKPQCGLITGGVCLLVSQLVDKIAKPNSNTVILEAVRVNVYSLS